MLLTTSGIECACSEVAERQGEGNVVAAAACLDLLTGGRVKRDVEEVLVGAGSPVLLSRRCRVHQWTIWADVPPRLELELAEFGQVVLGSTAGA